MNKPILVPIPKKIEWKEGTFNFKGETIDLYFDFLFADSFANEIRELEEFTDKKVRLVSSDEAEIVFVKEDGLDDEEHKIDVATDKITITASKPVGVFRAITTLKQIYKQCGEFLCLKIYDKPDMEMRQGQFDFRHRVPKLQELKNIVQFLADMKYNEYILYFESLGFYYSNFPQFYDDSKRVLMPEEVKELDEFCRERYVKLIPFQASFGHMGNWLAHEELKDLGIPEEGGGGSLNPLDPRSIELVEKIYDCFLPCFSSDYVIIGFDEVVELGLGKTKEAAEKVGIENLFLDFLLKVNELANKKYGKKVMYAADMLYKYPDIWEKMPQNAITLIWDYNAYGRYYDKQAPEVAAHNKDFIINSSTSNFCSFTGRTENALYNIKDATYIINKYKNARGMQVTDWGDCGHPQFDPISYFGYVVAACYCWNSDESVAVESEYYSDWKTMMEEANWTNEFVDHTIQYTAIDYLNYVVFDCKNARLGDLLYRMGNYRYIEGENVGSSTRCYQLYMQGKLGGNGINISRQLLKKIPPEYYWDVITYMENIYAELEKAKGENDFTKLALEEMKCNTKMVILTEKALVLQYYYLNDSLTHEHILQADRLADEFCELSEQFKELWMYRNQPHGYEYACNKFTSLADSLKQL